MRLSAKLLRHAEVGVYSKQEVARGLDPNWLRSYLHERGGRWSVGPEVRKLVRFERHNLLDGSPHDSAEFDVILARNVLIYFAEGARARVFSGFRRAIRDDGYLFLGESETILGRETDFAFAERGMDYYRPAPRGPNIFAASPY